MMAGNPFIIIISHHHHHHHHPTPTLPITTIPILYLLSTSTFLIYPIIPFPRKSTLLSYLACPFPFPIVFVLSSSAGIR